MVQDLLGVSTRQKGTKSRLAPSAFSYYYLYKQSIVLTQRPATFQMPLSPSASFWMHLSQQNVEMVLMDSSFPITATNKLKTENETKYNLHVLTEELMHTYIYESTLADASTSADLPNSLMAVASMCDALSPASSYCSA